MATCPWQGISHRDWNLQPSLKLPTLLSFSAQGWGGGLSLRRTLASGSRIGVASHNYKHAACNERMVDLFLRRAMFSLRSFFSFLDSLFSDFLIILFSSSHFLQKILVWDDEIHFLFNSFSLSLFAWLKLFSQQFSLFTWLLSLTYCILNVLKSLNLATPSPTQTTQPSNYLRYGAKSKLSSLKNMKFHCVRNGNTNNKSKEKTSIPLSSFIWKTEIHSLSTNHFTCS